MNNYSNNLDKNFKVEVTFPITDALFIGLTPLVVIILAEYLRYDSISNFTLGFSIIYLFIAYIIVQFLCVKIVVFKNKLRIKYYLSFFLKDREYLINDIEIVFFQYHTGLRSLPHLTIVLKKNRKKLQLSFFKSELSYARYELENVGIKIVIAKHILDTP